MKLNCLHFQTFFNIFTILPFSSDSKQRIENFAEILSGEIILGLRSPLADDFTEAQKYYWSSCPIKKGSSAAPVSNDMRMSK